MSTKKHTQCRNMYLRFADMIYHLRQLRPVTRSLTPAAAQTVVQAFTSCRLDRCNSLLYGISENLMRRVQSVQNAAARLLTGTRRQDHILPVLRHLHWLPVRRRIDFKLACLVHLSLPGQAPHYLAEDIHLVAAGPGRQLRSSTDRPCSVPRTYSMSGDRSFAAAGTRVWNNLPSNLRSFQSFRRLLKTHWLTVDHSAMWTFIYCAIEIHLLTYLLTYKSTEVRIKKSKKWNDWTVVKSNFEKQTRVRVWDLRRSK